jgi:transposase
MVKKTQEEKQILRKTIIKLYFEKKKSQLEIAQLLDISQSQVSFWIIRFKTNKKLEDLPKSGRKGFISKKQKEDLKKDLLGFPPSRYGGKSSGWTTKMAINFIHEKYNVKYSIRRTQELLREFGLSLITPRSEHYKASKLVRNTFREDMKKNSKMSIWISPSLISMKQPSD